MEAKNSSSVIISWDPIPKYLSGGIIKKYLISYAAVVDRNNIKSVHVDGPNVSYVLPYLKCYTGYLLRVSAYTKDGGGPETELEFFETAEGSESFCLLIKKPILMSVNFLSVKGCRKQQTHKNKSLYKINKLESMLRIRETFTPHLHNNENIFKTKI